ncbi:hypothetical protein PYR74_14820 [Acinetobacter bereziniae]|nr:hypothetical protein PYR74_14820 [Acinetobacter bereziniae]
MRVNPKNQNIAWVKQYKCGLKNLSPVLDPKTVGSKTRTISLPQIVELSEK